MFPDRVTLGDDGEYRWRYDQKANHNIDMYVFWTKTAFIISSPVCLFLLVGLWQHSPWLALLCGLGIFAFPALLVMLVWALFPPEIAFRLAENEIEVWPKSRRDVNIYEFRHLRRITLYPEKDKILLKFIISRLPVYVPKEDYELVQNLLRERAPQGTEFFR